MVTSLTELPASRLPAAGIALYAAPDAVTRPRLLGAAAHVRWMRRLRRELRPDVVHGHWLCGFAFFAAVAGAKPLAAMAWGSDVLKARPTQTAANRVALRRAALVLADSQALLDRLVAARGAAGGLPAGQLGGRPRAVPAGGGRGEARACVRGSASARARWCSARAR